MGIIHSENTINKNFKQREKIAFKREFSMSLGGYVWSSQDFDGEYLSKRYALESVAIVKLNIYREELKWISDSILEYCLYDKGWVVTFEEMTWAK